MKVTVSPEAAASVHDDGIVILQTRRGRLFSSNRTGAQIWRCLEQHLPMESIAEKIGAEYQIAAAVAREHTVRFLAELERHCLIERGAQS
jgi:hypothetical protein